MYDSFLQILFLYNLYKVFLLYLGLYEWTREESLSEITTAEFVDLPLADATTSDDSTTSGSSTDEEMGPDDPETQSLPLFQRFLMRVSIQWREVRVSIIFEISVALQ